MHFSILIPTRKRPQLLHNLIESIVRNTKDLSNTEIIVTYDNDDQFTRDSLTNFVNNFGSRIKLEFHGKDRTFNLNHDYYNWMATNFATGKYLIAVNDDTVFEREWWDEGTLKLLEEYEKKHPDGILYGVTDDMEVETKRTDNNWFSCFPLISKKSVDVLGFFFDPCFPKDGADWDIFGLYKAVDRVIDIRPTCVIKHISVRSHRRERDALDFDCMEQTGRIITPAQAGINTDKYAKFLKEYIIKCPQNSL